MWNVTLWMLTWSEVRKFASQKFRWTPVPVWNQFLDILIWLQTHYVNLPFHLFPRKSVNHVMNQSKKQTHLLIVFRRGLGLGQVFPNFLWPSTSSAFRYMKMYL